ncbi:unnamed protein product [Spirodela intermedia]|uniref:Uncharacterized protein n=2 Tax=Spirodela intermedia TaxID=51605 RepID=A0A7I8LLT1_SPIIN|nr:unnamed protein product [Spirodela intermedia]CAA6673780.1 unnamed protein product [Spirodela intermedia]CAA7411017.1 unnamed protein product [Spirodela intermedia]
MVLWEITVATAYFLGLKRTYRLALKLQRRVVSTRHPRLRGFLHRRTRVAFDIALTVHRKIQERDIELGRSVGNSILRWLDHMKPSAEIRLPADNLPRRVANSMEAARGKGPVSTKPAPRDSHRSLFTAPWHLASRSFPTISVMMRLPAPASASSQHRRISFHEPQRFEGVFREDIARWMQEPR